MRNAGWCQVGIGGENGGQCGVEGDQEEDGVRFWEKQGGVGQKIMRVDAERLINHCFIHCVFNDQEVDVGA